MQNRFMRVQEVAEELGVSESYAYSVIRKLNKELEAKGYLTISGRVSKEYFNQRLCYANIQQEKGGQQDGCL